MLDHPLIIQPQVVSHRQIPPHYEDFAKFYFLNNQVITNLELLFDVKRAIFVLIWQRYLQSVLAARAQTRLWMY